MFEELHGYISELPADVRGIVDGHKVFTGPEHVVIDLTNACNLRCLGCWTYSPLLGKVPPPPGWISRELSPGSMRKLIDDLAEMGTSRIRFTGGGEPFLHKNVRELIAQVKKKGIICSVTTNFSTVNEDTVRFLIDVGVDDLAISLWAHNAHEYSLLHPGSPPELFSHIERMLRLLAGLKSPGRPRLLICNVLTNVNYQNAIPMFNLALSFSADAVYFTLVDVIEGKTDALLLNKRQREFLFQDLCRMEEIANNPPGGKPIELENIEGLKKRLLADESDSGKYDAGVVDEMPCYVGWMFSRIMANGDVSPCCRGVNIPVGNINRTCFKEIWSGRRYAEFRDKALRLKKSDPYFSGVGCYKACDNLMHNRNMHDRILGYKNSIQNR